MSLSIDGVWKAGVWAQTVWGEGVWFEGQQPPPQNELYSGGFFDLPAKPRKSKADLRKEREEWGILPKKAKAIIKRVAAQQVEEPDNTEALIQAFERASVAYLQQYEALFRQEVLRIQREQEEEEIFLLLH